MSEALGTGQPSEMKLTWEHRFDDHVTMMAYQFFKVREGSFAKHIKRRRIVILSITVLCIAALWGVMAGWVGFVLALIVMPALFGVFWLMTKFIGGGYAENSRIDTLARRYVESLPVVPLGEYHLTVGNGFVTFLWVEGEETTILPTRRIDALDEFNGRLFLLERGEHRGSVPLHAFGDRQTRDSFCALLLDSSMRENSNV